MPGWNLCWWRARKRQAQLDAYLKTENHESNRLRRERDEAEKAIDLKLHDERRQGSNWLQNREMRVTALYVEWARDMITRRIALRRKLAVECPELLSDAELAKLEEQMIQNVRTLRQAKRDDYARRTRAAGVEMRRSEQREAAQYGELEAIVRREVEQLRLSRTLGTIAPKKEPWSRDQKIAVWKAAAAFAAVLAAALIGLLSAFVPELRRLFGFE